MAISAKEDTGATSVCPSPPPSNQEAMDQDSAPETSSTRESSVILLDSDPSASVQHEDVQMAEPSSSTTTTTNPPLPPPSASAPITKSTKPVSTAKPRSTKHKARTPSPSPPPPPPPPPLETIRLQIKLGGADNYAVDIADMSRATGQRPPTPVITVTAVHSDSDDDEGNKTDDKKDKKKKKKKNPTYEHYDITDPFIDDSELALDQRTFFAQTKHQGFYVSSGEVALLKDKSPKKPKSKNPLLAVPPSISASAKKSLAHKLPLPSSSKTPLGVGIFPSATAPLPTQAQTRTPGLANRTSVSDDEGGGGHGGGHDVDVDMNGHGAENEPTTGQKRKRWMSVTEGGKKRKVVDPKSFNPLIQDEIQALREAVAKENWDQKGKFPPAIKPLLSKIAILAIKLDEYDDYFFSLMPSIFPYNKFTMSKLIKRTVYPEHIALLVQRQETLLTELKEQADAGFPKAQEEWEKAVIAWDKRKSKMQATDPSTGAPTGEPGTASDSTATTTATAPTRHPTEEMDVDAPSPSAGPSVGPKGTGTSKDEDGKDTGKDKDASLALAPPGKKYRLTESMKAIIWQLVLLSNECCRLENEKNTLENSVIQVSEQGLRKALYQKIIAAFPEGWLSSGQISRDVSAMKKRFEREAMEQEGEQEY
ncbi:hypothetical protein H0H92_013821 [Tricholoma furcatifolium]|nr:hypothetical protein H0H92_013821 [Tricholoma furcatifolium]